jgi:hypothetical protein
LGGTEEPASGADFPVREPKVPVFFYGSYMNADVLKDVGLAPDHFEVAKLDGFDIRIEPLANLVPSPQRCVYGLLAHATHAELERLYAHAREVLGATYLPHPVLVETADAGLRPALCYLAPAMTSGATAADYLDRILQPARQFRFPRWYLQRLESFRP